MQLVLGPIELRDASQRLLRHQRLVINGDLQQHMGQFAVGKLHGLGVAHAANFVPQEARDDRDIAEPNDDERQSAGRGDGVDDETQKVKNQASILFFVSQAARPAWPPARPS